MSKSYANASKLTTKLKSHNINMSEEDMASLLMYSVSCLIVAQFELNALIGDEHESKIALQMIQISRLMIVNALERYDDYTTRMAMLNLYLGDSKWRVGDSLCGADHSFVLGRLERVPASDLICSCCHGNAVEEKGFVSRASMSGDDEEMRMIRQ